MLVQSKIKFILGMARYTFHKFELKQIFLSKNKMRRRKSCFFPFSRKILRSDWVRLDKHDRIVDLFILFNFCFQFICLEYAVYPKFANTVSLLIHYTPVDRLRFRLFFLHHLSTIIAATFF